ncbi:Protein of uncharacterised function (DUF1602) [uncultured Butyricicoccus sp.]|nr:Protein of uncharacterised function (DUF1602) [uncultured Butyricicoccus sp.]
MSCVTNTMVLFSFCCKDFISCCKVRRVMGSSALNGSSISTIGGDAASARRMPIRCCCPPDISDGYLCAYCSYGISTMASMSRTICSH